MISAIWYVRSGKTILGTIIAKDKESALYIAEKKFPTSIEQDPIVVERKRLKRKNRKFKEK